MVLISPSYLQIKLLSVIFISFISLYFGSLYIKGDQVFYTAWYYEFGSKNLSDAYTFFSTQINPFEVFYFFPTWLGASFLDKIYFDTIVNLFLVWVFISVLQKFSMHPFVIFFVVSTSFYLPVLMLAAERLKFGFLAGFLVLLAGTHFKRLFWVLASLMGHLQMVIPLAAFMSGSITNKSGFKYFKSFITGPGYLLLALFSIVIMALFIYKSPVFVEYIQYKFDSYVKFSLLDFFKPFVFLILSLYCARSHKGFIFGFFTLLCIASLVIGAERITIISYFGFLFFSSFRNRGLNLANFIIAPYMLIKSLLFYSNIINTGSGF